jgi:methylenetetrahydrofolate dehydrogenase (NADP+) / methenyltetrahydrofolate cyclohydrolase
MAIQTQLLKAREVAQASEAQLHNEVHKFKAHFSVSPQLAVVLVGHDPASQVYVRRKHETCHKLGIRSVKIELHPDITEKELLHHIQRLNADPDIDGILVQMPLPSHLDAKKIIEGIDPLKDVDGLTTSNLGALVAGNAKAVSCTPKGVISLLKFYDIQLKGLNCAVVGRSLIVGKPMALLLQQEDATVTMCHSATRNLKGILQQMDLVVIAAGKPMLFGKEFFREGAVVVDVGIHRIDNGQICGDLKATEMNGHLLAYTPVPGGVGPMTIISLMENVVKLAFNRRSNLK